MKKVMISLVGLLAMVSFALADVYDFTATGTNGQAATISAQIPNVSGYLDKIEIYNSQVCTSTVIIATYASDNTTAIETYATAAVTAAKVIRLRVLPTDNTGTSLASVAGTGTNTLTQLNVSYAMPLIGSNLRMSVATVCHDGTTNTVHARFFFVPTPSK